MVDIEEIVLAWGVEAKTVQQVCQTVWKINDQYFLKQFLNHEALKRNVCLTELLHKLTLSAARLLALPNGKVYVDTKMGCCILMPALCGNKADAEKTIVPAYSFGKAIGALHLAFQKCGEALLSTDWGFLGHMSGWVWDVQEREEWRFVEKVRFEEAFKHLQEIYERLPRQLIHRDVNYDNFLFDGDTFLGYIDFDLCQTEIRVYDICYAAFMLYRALRSRKEEYQLFPKVKALFQGYIEYVPLTTLEIQAVGCIMENIALSFISYYWHDEAFEGVQEAIDFYNIIYIQRMELHKYIG